MLKPSYSELMDVLNLDSELDKQITSSYAIVIAASKRARQLINGAEPLAGAATDKAVSIAVNEICEGHIHIMPESKKDETEAFFADEAVIGAAYLSDEGLDNESAEAWIDDEADEETPDEALE